MIGAFIAAAGFAVMWIGAICFFTRNMTADEFKEWCDTVLQSREEMW